MTDRRTGLTLVLVLAQGLLGCGQAVTPSATVPSSTSSPARPEPTALSTGQPTLPPPIIPTDLPGSPPAPSADPVFGALLPHIPEAVRDSCVASEPLEPILAIVSCSVGDGEVAVEYAMYPNRDSMYAAYNERVRVAAIETDSGLCYTDDGDSISATTGRWPAENPYSVDGSAAGRYLCRGLEFPTIAWTNDSLLIMGIATADPAFVDHLVTFWVNESGPVP
ncbi:MAG: hypothetical protein WD830_03675 [Chloroflexota bacterium]